jgi:4-carboxymuconolactone decarboxylase
MARLPPIDEHSDPELAAVFAEIAGSRGWVSNVMRALAHAPEGLRRFAHLGDYARYHTTLSDRQREIVILITGRGVHYARTHHGPLGRQAGLADAELEAIGAGRLPGSFGEKDATLARLILEVAGGKPVSAATFAAAEQALSPREITDALLISAFYTMIAMVIGTMGVELETKDQLEIERAWQRQRSDGTQAPPEGGH